MAFRENLGEQRKRLKYTQKELAEKVGVSTASIIAYESGEKKPSFDVLLRLSDALNISLDLLCKSGLSASGIQEPQIKTLADVYTIILPLAEALGFGSEWLKSSRPPLGSERIEIVLAEGYTDERTGRKYGFSPAFLALYEEFKEMGDLLAKGTIKQHLYKLWLTDKLKECSQYDVFGYRLDEGGSDGDD